MKFFTPIEIQHGKNDNGRCFFFLYFFFSFCTNIYINLYIHINVYHNLCGSSLTHSFGVFGSFSRLENLWKRWAQFEGISMRHTHLSPIVSIRMTTDVPIPFVFAIRAHISTSQKPYQSLFVYNICIGVCKCVCVWIGECSVSVDQ